MTKHYYYYIVEIKYLFDENNERDLLFSLCKDCILKLWNINKFECLFDIKIDFYEISEGFNHLGMMKLDNECYNIIVANERGKIKVFDLNGNKLNDDYRNNLNLKNEIKEITYVEYIDTYYDKKLSKTFVFLSYGGYNKLYSFDYQNEELYQEYGLMYYGDRQIVMNNDDENLIKVIYFIN